MSSIIFPLATNIKSLQKWGDNDITKRIKQSLILYDKVIVETGTYNFQGAGSFVLQGFEPWEKNSKGEILKKMEQIENRQEDRYIRIFDGKTHLEKKKYKIDKKYTFLADYRSVDIISEINAGKYGKIDFLQYLDINRQGNHWKNIEQNTIKDLSDSEFADIVSNIHGKMPTIVFLNNLNDSLAMSHALNAPIAVDSIYASLLKLKTKCRIGSQFSTLEKLAKIGVPDFGDLDLEKILELRKDKALASFRNLISALSLKVQCGNNLDIEAIFTQELFKEIKELAPTKKRIALNTFIGALSNLPCPIIGAVTSVSEVGKEIKEYRDFSSNWLSFLLKANE